MEEFANYQDGNDNYEQKIEDDARNVAEMGSIEYIERVNEYLNK